MNILFLIIGLILGGIVAWFVAKNRLDTTAERARLEAELSIAKERAQSELKAAKENSLLIEKQLHDSQEELREERDKTVSLNRALAARNAEYTALEEKLQTQKSELEDLHKKFNDQFTNLAQRILDEKTAKFTQQNKENIDAVLKPLNEKLQDFGKKVEDTYEKNSKDSTRLQTEINKLYELNTKMSRDANNLTKALKGDVKKQGNWGEMILEKILERSGLRKDIEYKTQDAFRDEENHLYKPDVVIYLPEGKNIIIDAKVSLTAYEQLVNTDDKEEQERYTKRHLQSVKSHIKELADKEYHKLPGLNTPEYVLMFIPIEASFSAAIREDAELFNYAWDNKIVIVSPSTLTATLMTVSSIWRQEQQTQNALEIAKKSGDLYDKFAALVQDLIKVGDRINQTKTDYDKAMNKLSTGRGNLITRVEGIKKLGAKASKSIDKRMLDRAEEL